MGDVSVRFLGSGDAFGSGGRFQTCIYVRAGGSPAGATHLLVDCGASSLIAMKRFGVDPSLVDTILLTHLHGDHFGGLPFFVMDAQYVSRRSKPLIVAGPPGLEARIFESMEVLFPGSSGQERGYELRFVELQEGAINVVGPLAVTPYAVVHPSGAPSYALRISLENRILAYSGDTSWTDALIPAAKAADLFVCDCHSFDGEPWYHLDYRTLMEHRGQLGCRRLVLTHMSDDMLGRIGSLELQGAEDGMEISL